MLHKIGIFPIPKFFFFITNNYRNQQTSTRSICSRPLSYSLLELPKMSISKNSLIPQENLFQRFKHLIEVDIYNKIL